MIDVFAGCLLGDDVCIQTGKRIAQLPNDVRLDGTGNAYIVDLGGGYAYGGIVAISPNGTITKMPGYRIPGFGAEGAQPTNGDEAIDSFHQLESFPLDIDVDQSGNV
jgi:hypothetical protein